MFVSLFRGRGERSLGMARNPGMSLRFQAREPESGGEVAERGRLARNRYVAPCFRVTGTVMCFRRRRLCSARPVHASRRGRASGGCLRGFPAFPDPDLFAAFSPVRRKPATGGRLPGLPGPGVSTPRAVRRPHAPVIPHAAGFKPRKGPGDDYRTTFPARSHPAARDWPWRQTPSPRDGMGRIMGRGLHAATK